MIGGCNFRYDKEGFVNSISILEVTLQIPFSSYHRIFSPY